MQVRPAADANAAEWARRALEGDNGGTVRAYVPAGYESYARVFHEPYWVPPEVEAEHERLMDRLIKAAKEGGADAALISDLQEELARLESSAEPLTTWAEVAAANGKIAHPLMQWHQIATTRQDDDSLAYEGPEIEMSQAEALVAALRPHTSTPGDCIFCVWDGYGFDEIRPRTAPRARFFHRHMVFEGPIDDVSRFVWDGAFEMPPNMWWPEDRSWFVATEIDEDCTYVGGSKAAVEAVLVSELEAAAIDEIDEIGCRGDLINGSQASGS